MKTIYFISLMAAASLLAFAGPVRATEMDDRIEASARESYVFKTFLQGDDIKIRSRDGFVTMTGIVSEESRRGLASETVAGLPEVRSVDNRLAVKGAPPTPNSDAWLREKVRATLLFHRSVGAVTTGVEVKDGIVTLRGEAANQARKELATEYARDVEGVKKVENEMTLSNAPESTMEKVFGKIDDASITAQVKMALLFHRSTSALHTKVETREGVVTMYGNAGSNAEKDLVDKLVNDINGVQSVNNRMAIGK